MPPRGAARRGAVFNAIVLASGFIAGGLLTQVARKFLPPGAAKEFFTTGVTPSVGPLTIRVSCAVTLVSSLGMVSTV